jgi:hypothetical protein
MAGVTDSEERANSTSRRHLATWLIVGFGVLLILAGVVVSFLTGTVFQWAAVLFAGGIIGFLFAGFVWIRLAD